MRMRALKISMIGRPKMERKEYDPSHWIQSAIHHPGILHEELHVKKEKKIPFNKLNRATHSRSPLERKRATLAITLRGFHKGRS